MDFWTSRGTAVFTQPFLPTIGHATPLVGSWPQRYTAHDAYLASDRGPTDEVIEWRNSRDRWWPWLMCCCLGVGGEVARAMLVAASRVRCGVRAVLPPVALAIWSVCPRSAYSFPATLVTPPTARRWQLTPVHEVEPAEPAARHGQRTPRTRLLMRPWLEAPVARAAG
jgi:hypothetical protein